MMSSDKPLGVFWHVSDTHLLDNLSASDCVNGLRRFLTNKYDCIEYQFNCVCNRSQINDNIIEILRVAVNDCQIVEFDSDSQTVLELHNIIDQFVQNYGFESIVAIISDNPCLSQTIRLVTHKEVYVVVIYGRDPSQELLSRANEAIHFDDIFGINRKVVLSVSNIPTFRSRKAIRTAFQPICRQFRSKFRFVRKDMIKLEFNNLIDAQNAETEINSKKLSGNNLFAELNIPSDIHSVYSDSSSSPESLLSMQLSPKPEYNPQKDDECKSVIIGLFSKANQNVYNLVRDMVNSWNDSSVNGTMILRVNREKDFLNRDGKASLIVTAIDRKTNNKLISVAKKMFVNREKKLFWNRLRRSPKRDAKPLDCITSPIVPNDCRSVVIGLWTRHDENVLKTIKNLVKSWDTIGFDIKCIINVERSKKFAEKDGKASLIVSTNSPENNRKLLELASIKFHNRSKKFYWKSIEKGKQD